MNTPSARPDHVRIVEVGARDGLQNEKTMLPTDVKIALIDRLSGTGLRTIEATSFVSPKWVPQTGRRRGGLRRHPQATRRAATRCWCRTEQGYERARAVGVTEIAVFTAASEAFNRKNINASIDESIERFTPVMERAQGRRRQGARLCIHRARLPVSGRSAVADVVRVASRLHELGCYEISLGDTIGVGTPAKARAMLHAVAHEVPMAALAVHFHDTYGQALANILALPGRRRRGRRQRRSPAPAVARMRMAPPAMSPAKTWSTCCMAWACTPASTWTSWWPPAPGWPPSCTRKPPAG